MPAAIWEREDTGEAMPVLVTCYDTRVGTTPKEVSIIEKSHRDPVYKIAWLHGAARHPCGRPADEQSVRFQGWGLRAVTSVALW